MVLGGRVGLAKRKQTSRDTRRRVAPGNVRRPPQAVQNQTVSGDACDALGNFGCRAKSHEGFYTALDGGLDVMLCQGPCYKCILYWGNTWPLEVVAWWFWKSSGVCKIVACTDKFQKIALLGVIQRVWQSWGQIRTTICIEELHLVLRIPTTTSLFPRVDYRWWPVVGEASRHLWQQRQIKVIIKGCRIKRSPKEVLKIGV